MKDFLRPFLDRSGGHVLIAGLLTKVLGFGTILLVTRAHTETEYGAVAFAQSLVNACIPFMGLGAYQAFVRFGSDLTSPLEHEQLYRYAFRKGMLVSLVLSAGLASLAPKLAGALNSSIEYILILSPSMLTVLMMEYAKARARLDGRNRTSALIDIVFAVTLALGAWGLPQVMGIAGYAVSLTMAPLIAAFIEPASGWRGTAVFPQHMSKSRFWGYGMHVSIGAFSAQLFYVVDIWLIGLLLPDAESQVAVYRVAALIPLAGLIVPMSVAAADFATLSAQKHDAAALKSYVRGYLKTFAVITPLAWALLTISASALLPCFGPGYAKGGVAFQFFVFGMAGAWLFRVPFGNMLSAVGRADWNTVTNLITIALSVTGCALFIPRFGIEGAAAVTASLMWATGLISLGLFRLHIKRISEQ